MSEAVRPAVGVLAPPPRGWARSAFSPQHLGLGGVVTAESWLGSFCWLRLWLHGVEGGGIGGPSPLTSRSQTCLLACAPWPLQVSGRGEK